MDPRISVVIPTYARETRLAFALESLARQTLDGNEFEVIVVRAPGAPTPWAEPPSEINVRYLESKEKGPGPQRNVGWRAARAPLVGFVDDDCRLAPDWLVHMLDAVEREAAAELDVVVQGRTAPDPDELHLLTGLARSIEISAPTHLYETCNLVYPYVLLERLGGFDPSFATPHWGEDTDLGLRAERAGARLVWAGDALAWHAVHPNPLPRALREAQRRRWQAHLIARNPELRARMPARLFVNESHLTIALAAVGIAAGRALRAPGLGWASTLPYLSLAVRNLVREGAVTPRRVARLAVHMPARTAVDVTAVAATVLGAVEERTPVI